MVSSVSIRAIRRSRLLAARADGLDPEHSSEQLGGQVAQTGHPARLDPVFRPYDLPRAAVPGFAPVFRRMDLFQAIELAD